MQVWESTWRGRIADGTIFGQPEYETQRSNWDVMNGWEGGPCLPRLAEVVTYLPEIKHVAVVGLSRPCVERLLHKTVRKMKAEL
jgi:hypothetical protein